MDLDYIDIGRAFLIDHIGITPYPYQNKIIEAILDRRVKRTTIRATTQCGKSYTVAGASVAFACVYANSKVGIIAPSKDKTKIIMTYILEMLSSSDLESEIDLDMMGLTKMERLKREVSKQRVTFKNGSSIEIKTADVKGKGFSLMGASYDLIIIDESAELTEEVWTKIARMLLKNPNSKIVELYNPWFLNHTFEHSQDPDWNSIKIDWHTCLEQGRFTQEQIDIVMQEIRNPIDQRVLLDAEFPDTSDKSLFKYSDILFAQREIQEPKEEPEIRLGIDVARFGRDDTICYLIYRYGGLFVVKDMWKLDKQRLTKSAGDIIKIIEDNNVKVVQIDSTGIGAGLDDMLSEYANSKNIDVVSIVFSEKPNDIHNANRKADIYFNLSELFAKKSIVIPTDNTLVRQLRNMQFEVMSNGKKKIVDNQEKSPDCFIAGTKVLTSKGYKNIEEIDYNDKIITPYGTREVIHKVEKETNELVHITFTNGKELYTTPNHKIFTNNTFIKASDLNVNNRINTDAIGELLKWRLKNLLNIKGRSIGFRQTRDTTMPISMTEQVERAEKRKHCTDKYMKTLLEKEYQKDASYIILMEIFTIIIQRIWNLLQKQIITSYIWLKNIKIRNLLKGIKQFWTKSDQKQKCGIVQKQGEIGTENNTQPLLKMQGYTIKSVYYAEKSIKQSEKKNLCSVVKNAVGHIEIIKLEKPVKVYNITVSKDNVYYANSILVSNCADALAIGCYVVETNNKMWIDGKWV